MSQATSSERIQLLIAGYVLGDLSSDEAQELTRLMAENPTLAEEIHALQDVSETMQDITDIAPPSHLRDRVIDSTTQPIESAAMAPPARVPSPTLPTLPTPPSPPSPPAPSASPTPLIAAPDNPPPPAPISPLPTQPRRKGFWVTGGAIAAALIVGLGFNNYRLWNALQVAQTEINQTDSVTYSLTSPEATSTASASVIVHPKTLEAQVKAQGLTALPPGQVYAVWTLPEPDFPATTDAKGAILTGVFQVDAAGSAATTISVPAVHRHPEAIAKVAITVEDANAPQQHTGSVIIITQ